MSRQWLFGNTGWSQKHKAFTEKIKQTDLCNHPENKVIFTQRVACLVARTQTEQNNAVFNHVSPAVLK